MLFKRRPCVTISRPVGPAWQQFAILDRAWLTVNAIFGICNLPARYPLIVCKDICKLTSSLFCFEVTKFGASSLTMYSLLVCHSLTSLKFKLFWSLYHLKYSGEESSESVRVSYTNSAPKPDFDFNEQWKDPGRRSKLRSISHESKQWTW